MICVDAYGYYLTLDKFYPVIHRRETSYGDMITVINDIGEEREYPAECFA